VLEDYDKKSQTYHKFYGLEKRQNKFHPLYKKYEPKSFRIRFPTTSKIFTKKQVTENSCYMESKYYRRSRSISSTLTIFLPNITMDHTTITTRFRKYALQFPKLHSFGLYYPIILDNHPCLTNTNLKIIAKIPKASHQMDSLSISLREVNIDKSGIKLIHTMTMLSRKLRYLTLELPECKLLGDNDLKCIVEGLRRIPKLEFLSLNFSKWENFTDDSIIILTKIFNSKFNCD